MRNVALLFTLLVVTAAQAQDSVTILKAARMIDARGESVIEPAVIVVRGNKIESAGTSGVIPPGAQVMDLGDVTLLPGPHRRAHARHAAG